MVSNATNDDTRCSFITHNTKDFSDASGDFRKPHQDLLYLFESPRSSYWTSLVELLKDLSPDILGEHDFEFNYSQEARRLTEILEAEHLLFRQIWYNRHWGLRNKIENGEISVVPEEDYSRSPYRRDQILESVWTKALAAAKQTEEEVGIENLGPWSDFDWGMVNGKLSALRWVIGEEWDMLDS